MSQIFWIYGNQHIENTRDMGKFKFRITFNSSIDLEKAMEMAATEFSSKCISFAKWSENEKVLRRCTWVLVTGIPSHAWSMIQTNTLHFINKHIVLQVNETLHDILIKELENPIRPIPCYFCEFQGQATHGEFRPNQPSMETEEEQLNSHQQTCEERENIVSQNNVSRGADKDVDASVDRTRAFHIPQRASTLWLMKVRDKEPTTLLPNQ